MMTASIVIQDNDVVPVCCAQRQRNFIAGIQLLAGFKDLKIFLTNGTDLVQSLCVSIESIFLFLKAAELRGICNDNERCRYGRT
jgi:hypothetical protein